MADVSGIYMASKAVAHGPRWRALREQGFPILSSWIDESDPGLTLDWPDLWERCLSEVKSAAALIVYLEPGEVLKGAWIEVGAALALGIPVIGVGVEEHSISKSGKIRVVENLDTALEIAMTFVAAHRDHQAYLQQEAADPHAPERTIGYLREELEALRDIAIEYRKSGEAARALVEDCATFLKEGETPRQRMERDQADILGLMALLAKEKKKNEALGLGKAEPVGAGERPEGEIPDCPLCLGPAKLRNWTGNGFTEARVAYQQVRCAAWNCGCQTPAVQVLSQGENPALEIWSRRVRSAAPVLAATEAL